MNTISRGIRNAFRNTIRTGSIIAILALSIGLIIAMLAARQAVSDRIDTIKGSSGNTISISPAGVRGFDGGGTALTAEQLAEIAEIEHVTTVVNSLNTRLDTADTNIQSAITPGTFGNRQTSNSANSESAAATVSSTQTMSMPIMVTGVSDARTIGGGLSSLTWTEGAAFDASEDTDVAVIGSAIAAKNNLSVGSTFTAYSGTVVTVVGIYKTENTFSDNSIYFPLTTLQRLSGQTESISATTVTVDSSDNLATTTDAVKTTLGTAADVTNSQDVANATTKPLESVKQIALFNLMGATVAGAVIILLTMLMIVRERRREIGVMKAIGSSNIGIMWQFIIEALTLTTAGLVVGIAIGVAAAAPLTTILVDNSTSSTMTQSQGGRPGGGPGGFRGAGRAAQAAVQSIQTSVGATTLAAGVGATLLIAILGSAVPALMISNIKPADAMRSE